MSGSFQTHTNAFQAPLQAGDFASANPRAVPLSSQWTDGTGITHTAPVAGDNGLTIGLFAWLDAATYSIASNTGPGAPTAFVHRAAEALITTYLTAYGATIPAGFPAGNLFVGGDFGVVNNGLTEATPGMKAYANNTTGVASFAASGAPTTGGSGDSSTITHETSSFTGTIVDDVMTVSGAVTGTIYIGTVLSGTNVASGTQIVGKLTGTGGDGTYLVAPRNQTVASTAIGGKYGLLTVGGTVVAGFAANQTVVSTSTPAGTVITELGTGTGGAGTYIVSYTAGTDVSAEAIHTVTNTETGWYCRSFAGPGEVAKISSNPIG